jgi:nitrogen regulatory protein PII
MKKIEAITKPVKLDAVAHWFSSSPISNLAKPTISSRASAALGTSRPISTARALALQMIYG